MSNEILTATNLPYMSQNIHMRLNEGQILHLLKSLFLFGKIYKKLKEGRIMRNRKRFCVEGKTKLSVHIYDIK